MEFFEVIKKRRSVRSFDQSKTVTDEQIKKILEAGRLAPSAHNYQDWFFVVVKKPDLKSKLVNACMGQEFVGQASVIIVVCADLSLADQHSSYHGENFYSIQDTAIATTQMWLAITALGLASCWVGAFYEQEIKEILHLGDRLRPVAVLPVGYPAYLPKASSRRPLKEISTQI